MQPYGQPGYAPQGYAPQGYAPQGYAPQCYAPQGYAPQGYAPQGYAPQPQYAPQPGAPQPYYPQQGYAPQGVMSPAMAYRYFPLPQGYNPQTDCAALRKAMKGIGTDEDAIINVVSHSSYNQRQAMINCFTQSFSRNLMADLKSEISGKFYTLVEGLFTSPDVYDAQCIHEALKGAGTNDDTLIEIVCTRSNDQINLIKSAYQRLYNKDLISDVKGDTSGTYEKVLVSMLNGCRSQNPNPDPATCQRDAEQLYKGGEGRLGTDESLFCRIFGTKSNAELRCIFQYYTQISGHDIYQAIQSEFSGNAKTAFLTMIECIMDTPAYFAARFYKSMKGAGTKDRMLMRLVITRNEVDLPAIKNCYAHNYGKDLASAISSDTSGDYKKLLVAIVNCRN